MTGLVILIPAAGASSRMRGGDKLLEIVDGAPLLARQAGVALGTGCPVLVTLSPDRPKRARALEGLAGKALDVRLVANASEGLSASIRVGASWAQTQGAQGMMILLADLPEIGAADLDLMVKARAQDADDVWRASDDSGVPGHPVIIPARLFDRLSEVSGDDGARSVLKGENARLVPLPGLRATTDLDTPEDWAAWRKRQS